MLSQYVVVYDVAHATGMADMKHMFLTQKGRSLRNGATFTSSVPLYGATDLKAGSRANITLRSCESKSSMKIASARLSQAF